MNDFRILSYIEESKLSIDEKIEYYKKLKEYLTNTNYRRFTASHLSLAESLNKKVTRSVIDRIKGYDLVVDGQENIPSSPVIYASTHQDFNDHFNVVLSIPEHAIILNTNTVTPLFKFIMWFNGIIYVDRTDPVNRFEAKIELMRCLSKGKSVVIFPEGTYNCSPNKLHLPLHKGVIDIARKMQVPIVPLIQDYTYDSEIPTIKNVKSCNVRFGTPIYVGIDTDTDTKLEELSAQFSSSRWDLIVEKGTQQVSSNLEYINYVLSRIDAWKKIKVSIDDERKTIYGADDEFYLFHHINDIAFDEDGNFLETALVQQLDEINSQHFSHITLDRNGNIVDAEKVLNMTRKIN